MEDKSSRSILLVGGGLLGSIFVHSLQAWMTTGEWHPDALRIMDYDEIEFRNGPSMLGVPYSVGISKAEFLSSLLDSMYGPQYLTVPRVAKITAKNVVKELEGIALVVGAVDNIPTRQVIWIGAKAVGIPYLDMGVGPMSGHVTWTFGEVDTNLYSPEGNPVPRIPEDKKDPPCQLIGTRPMAAIVAELAAYSMSIFWRGHDPNEIVNVYAKRKAKRGDMVTWHVSSVGNTFQVNSAYVGMAEGGNDE